MYDMYETSYRGTDFFRKSVMAVKATPQSMVRPYLLTQVEVLKQQLRMALFGQAAQTVSSELHLKVVDFWSA